MSGIDDDNTDKASSSYSASKEDNSCELQLQNFLEPDHLSDITLVVEDKPIHAHKTILSLASPVWMAMFSGDFKERRVDFVDLPGKVHTDVVELLEFVYPPCKKTVSEENVYRILPLSDEYQIKWLKDACEDFLVGWILQEASSERAQNTTEFAKICVQHLYLGQLYTLERLSSMAVNMAAELPFSVLKSSECFEALDCQTLSFIFEKREENCLGKVKFLEHQDNENKSRIFLYQQKCVEIATNALKIKRMGNYVRVCPADESSTCACDSCIFFGRYFERIVNQHNHNSIN